MATKMNLRPIVYQTVGTGTTVAQTSPPFSAQTRYLRIAVAGGSSADAMKYLVSQTGVSTCGTAYSVLGNQWLEYVAVSPGQQIVFQPLAAVTSLTFTITEME